MYNEGNYKQGEKEAFRMRENNRKWNWQRINLKNLQATPAAQFQKNKGPNQKVCQRTKQTTEVKRALQRHGIEGTGQTVSRQRE